MIDLSGVWGFNLPLVPLSLPKFVLNIQKIVKISQKFIADPLWFSHKSITDFAHPGITSISAISVVGNDILSISIALK